MIDLNRICYNCKKTIVVGADLYYQIDISFKGFYGHNISRGKLEEKHAAFCQNCGKGAEKLFDRIKIPKK